MLFIKKWQNLKPIQKGISVNLTLIFIWILVAFLPIKIEIQTAIGDFLLALSSFLATVAAYMAAYRSRHVLSKSITRAWFLIGVALSFGFMGDFSWMILEVVLKTSLLPSFADVLFIIFYFVLFIAVIQFPSVRREALDRTKGLLDLAIIIIGGILIFWNFIFGQLIQTQKNAVLFNQIMAIAYPVGDIILFTSVVLILYSKIHDLNWKSMLLVTLGLCLMVMTDILSYIQILNDSLIIGGMMIFGWIMQSQLFFLAAIMHMGSIRKSVEPESQSIVLVSTLSELFTYFPFLWLSAALLLLIRGEHDDLAMSFSQIGIAAIILFFLALFRQVINNIHIGRLIKDVETSQKKIEKQTRELHLDTLYDSLTNLPNRSLFMDRLESAIASTRGGADDSYAVLFLDLDEFKGINDSKGHLVGDELLKEVALRLKESVRTSDTIARLGGDEFLILLEDVGSRESIEKTTNRIIKNFSRKFYIDKHPINITVSIGVIVGIRGYKTITDILQDADIAMYHAKSSGKSQFCFFDPDMRNQTIRKIIIENELRVAVETNQFRMVYQPIIDLKSGEVISLEGLIRWKNPKLGNVPPDEFIRISEETGQIIKIGDWVLNETCSQVQRWHTSSTIPSHVSVNINISGIQFSRLDFIEKLQGILNSTGIDVSLLNLEITESVLIKGISEDNNLNISLSKLGIHLQIDDFGTGYSSFSNISRFPVNVLKVDRSFIQSIEEDTRTLELVRSIIEMAHGIGMKITAEGIETKSQKELLCSLGCDYGQGYFWAKPLEKEVVETYFSRGSKDAG